jgi:HPt (histidine-containing phosphotransfer) domain-containing protein
MKVRLAARVAVPALMMRVPRKARPAPMTAFSQQLDALHVRYARSLAAKHEALLGAWQAFSTKHDAATRLELHSLIHRLAGSAGSYGYMTLGVLAAAADRAFDAAGADGLSDRLATSVTSLLDELAGQAARVAADRQD